MIDAAMGTTEEDDVMDIESSIDEEEIEISPRQKELIDTLIKYEARRVKSASTLNSLSKMNGTKVSVQNLMKLTSLYEKALKDIEEEEEILEKVADVMKIIKQERPKKCKTIISEKAKRNVRKSVQIKMIFEHGRNIPVWRGDPTQHPPPLCGALPPLHDYVIPPGNMVAAYIDHEDEEDGQEWILAQMMNFITETREYEVLDVEKEEIKFRLCYERVIPLPQSIPDPTTHPQAIFAKDMLVLALYPQTTCLYRAVVYETPSRPEDEYILCFEDSFYTSKYSPPMRVSQRYVLCYRKIEDEYL